VSVHLVPMTEDEYGPWLEVAIRDYAQDHVADGSWTPDEAPQKSAAEFAALLPAGLATPDHYLFAIQTEAGETVGYLWFGVRNAAQRQAFVYDFLVFEAFRRQGYGEQAFAALETEVRALGLGQIGLHVFGANTAARNLYRKLGYQETNVIMRKDLAG
jgi:ribosomal protein S18 acetylase RimI-like enzyme